MSNPQFSQNSLHSFGTLPKCYAVAYRQTKNQLCSVRKWKCFAKLLKICGHCHGAMQTSTRRNHCTGTGAGSNDTGGIGAGNGDTGGAGAGIGDTSGTGAGSYDMGGTGARWSREVDGAGARSGNTSSAGAGSSQVGGTGAGSNNTSSTVAGNGKVERRGRLR